MKLQDKIKNGVYIIAEMSANHAGSLERDRKASKGIERDK